MPTRKVRSRVLILFAIVILTIMHGPTGNYNCRATEGFSGKYVNCNSWYEWIDELGEYWGFVILILLFCGLWIYLFKDKEKEESPKEDK